ncbi:hypothetical protein [Croceibacter atlanticus]|uniref:hypothetical protein n=1 Tax=Croceibacter atlanticus TaxID=313588 RepID=UPI002E156C98|nr:hypothetical protein VVL01_01575 [Croceibacter atlanticus]
MDRKLDLFLNVHIPSKGYHAHNGQVEVFDEKDLSYNCVCGTEHKVKKSIAIIDFPIENKAIYICPENENFLNLVKAKGWFSIKSLKSIASYKAQNENERMDIMRKLELRKKRG